MYTHTINYKGTDYEVSYNADVKMVDNGIGSYEYWGQKCIDSRIEAECQSIEVDGIYNIDADAPVTGELFKDLAEIFEDEDELFRAAEDDYEPGDEDPAYFDDEPNNFDF